MEVVRMMAEERELDIILVVIVDPAFEGPQPDGAGAVADHSGEAVLRQAFAVVFDMGKRGDGQIVLIEDVDAAMVGGQPDFSLIILNGGINDVAAEAGRPGCGGEMGESAGRGVIAPDSL